MTAVQKVGSDRKTSDGKSVAETGWDKQARAVLETAIRQGREFQASKKELHVVCSVQFPLLSLTLKK